MIWLLTNTWWLAPLGIVALACLHPAGWALMRRVPRRAWLVLAVVALLGLTFQCGRWYERSQHRSAQEAAESKADAKAADVAKGAQAKAGEARKRIREETNDAVRSVQETMRDVPATCPPVPGRVLDIGRDAVQGARDEVLPAEGR